MLNNILRILFPESCPGCKKPATDRRTAPICPECWQAISRYAGPICRKCGRPLVSDTSIICKDCIDSAPAFKQARSFGLYEGTLREAINLLKYYGIKRLSRPLAEMMLEMGLPEADAIIPMPLHKKRLRQREFNQSALLAKNISALTGMPVIHDCLIKARDTIPQVGLKATQRKKNIRKAFEITDSKLVQKKNILLIDDVFTTGATVRECSKLLKRSGTKNVYVITLAHGAGE